MKTKTLDLILASWFLFFLTLLAGCNSQTTGNSAQVEGIAKEDPTCDNNVMGVFITAQKLDALSKAGAVNNSGKKRLFIQFKTDDGKNFFPLIYAGAHTPYQDLTDQVTQMPFLALAPTLPYAIGNLEWEFDNGFTIPAGTQGAILIPIKNADDNYINYGLQLIPTTVTVNNKQFTLDTTSIKTLTPAQREELIEHALAVVGTAINPIPPKQ